MDGHFLGDEKRPAGGGGVPGIEPVLCVALEQAGLPDACGRGGQQGEARTTISRRTGAAHNDNLAVYALVEAPTRVGVGEGVVVEDVVHGGEGGRGARPRGVEESGRRGRQAIKGRESEALQTPNAAARIRTGSGTRERSIRTLPLIWIGR